ncbi:GGDEF domain-containing protein [Marinobacter sp. F3R11]|uniref:GGDEF domain-containing protein n=1 Tax=Marinobacter sp. F3R11 TaxID=2267231 RepID=UPI000DE95B2D|nr:GGDEF domain-containing protein [Marinobacter sp. F3R11]RBW51944.1 GGDEF domain-containing protein [Marinobacter sp. F3R11]
MLSRLKTDFQLSIITLLGVCAFTGVTPFVILRVLQGNVAAAIVDIVVLVSIAFGMVYAWITGDTRRTGFGLTVLICFGAIAAGIAGKAGFFWLYPCIVVSFFLVPPREAVLINLVAIVSAMIIQDDSFQSLTHMASFFATTVMTSVCAYVFAFRNYNHRTELELLATVDPLTGVNNRRSMDKALRMALSDALRTDRSYAVVMIDLDHFKKVNDEHGHSVGDEVLLSLVSLIQERIRKTDRLFRYGGEEFVLLLSVVDVNSLRMISANLQTIIRQQLRCREQAVTASFGVALLRENESVETWLKRADSALYRAKELGRDRIVFADNTPAEDGQPCQLSSAAN